jgi:predicted nucleic acid-binding protein
LIIDVLENDRSFGLRSASLLDDHLAQGLVACPVTVVELAPAFAGRFERQRSFMERVGIRQDEDWQLADTVQAHGAWYRHISRRRTRLAPKRPIADALIGAFSLRFSGLLTRNETDFRRMFPKLKIVQP